MVWKLSRHSVRDKNLVANVVTMTDVAGLLHRQDNPSDPISITAARKVVVYWGLWPLHCQLGKVESERVPGGCLRVPTTKLWLDLV